LLPFGRPAPRGAATATALDALCPGKHNGGFKGSRKQAPALQM